MKNLLLALFSLVIFSTALKAQSRVGIGETQINAGVGVSGWGIPLYVGVDIGVHEDVTVGGELSYRNYKEKYYGFSFNHRVYGLLVNGNYHFNSVLEIPDPWDVYAGLNLGYYAWSSDDTYPGSGASGLGIGIQVGGRYYFSENLGINAELGGGNAVSGLKIGISIKL